VVEMEEEKVERDLKRKEIAESEDTVLEKIDEIEYKEGKSAAWEYIAKIGKELKVIENRGLLRVFLNKINKKGKLVRDYQGGQTYGTIMPSRIRIYKMAKRYYALLYEDNCDFYDRGYILTKIVKF
jgi:hypothetical protein